jgi:hypothetical protein
LKKNLQGYQKFTRVILTAEFNPGKFRRTSFSRDQARAFAPMSNLSSPQYTAFNGFRRIAQGTLPDVALAVKAALDHGAAGPVLAYDDHTGSVVDIDTRGSEDDLRARLAPSAQTAADVAEGAAASAPGSRGRGRPRLGVVAREVTLLPRHWEWLNAQTGGASVALRKLVEHARRADQHQGRDRQEAAYRFMSAMAGDLPGFEEAIRALFANDRERFEACIEAWPADIRAHACKLAYSGGNSLPSA